MGYGDGNLWATMTMKLFCPITQAFMVPPCDAGISQAGIISKANGEARRPNFTEQMDYVLHAVCRVLLRSVGSRRG